MKIGLNEDWTHLPVKLSREYIPKIKKIMVVFATEIKSDSLLNPFYNSPHYILFLMVIFENKKQNMISHFFLVICRPNFISAFKHLVTKISKDHMHSFYFESQAKFWDQPSLIVISYSNNWIIFKCLKKNHAKHNAARPEKITLDPSLTVRNQSSWSKITEVVCS